MKLKWLLCVLMLVAVSAAVFILTAGSYKVEKTVPEAATPSDGAVSVSFIAGDGGILCGDAIVEVQKGGTIATTPQVQPDGGLEFMGWYVSGDPSEHLVDLEKLTVFSSMTLSAAYQ